MSINKKTLELVDYSQALIANGRGLKDPNAPKPCLCHTLCVRGGKGGHTDCFHKKTGQFPPAGYCPVISFGHQSRSQINQKIELAKPTFKSDFSRYERQKNLKSA